MRRYAVLAALMILIAGLTGCSDAHKDPLLASETPLWGVRFPTFQEPESVIIAKDIVLVTSTPDNIWTLDARSAADGSIRWTYRIDGYVYGRSAQTGPVVAEVGGRALVLIRDSFACDDHGNCAEGWRRPGLTALDLATGAVVWSAPITPQPKLVPARGSIWSDARLLGVTDGVAVLTGTYAEAETQLDPTSIRLAGIEVSTGKRLWIIDRVVGVSVGGGRAFANQVAKIDAKGRPVLSGSVVALDVRTGETVWTSGEKLQARGSSDDLVVAEPLEDPDEESTSPQTYSLLASTDGRVSRTGVTGECRWSAAVVVCVGNDDARLYTGGEAHERNRKFDSPGPGINDAAGRLMPLTDSYDYGRITGSYAIDAEGTVWEGTIPGPILFVGDRYVAISAAASYRDPYAFAIFEVAR